MAAGVVQGHWIHAFAGCRAADLEQLRRHFVELALWNHRRQGRAQAQLSGRMAFRDSRRDTLLGFRGA